MSHAFVRESDDQWLHDIAPTLNALIVYLTRENNGIRVYEKETIKIQPGNREVHAMSNGLNYYINDAGQWTIAD